MKPKILKCQKRKKNQKNKRETKRKSLKKLQKNQKKKEQTEEIEIEEELEKPKKKCCSPGCAHPEKAGGFCGVHVYTQMRRKFKKENEELKNQYYLAKLTEKNARLEQAQEEKRKLAAEKLKKAKQQTREASRGRESNNILAERRKKDADAILKELF